MKKWLPLCAFISFYLVLNVVGSLLLLWKVEPFFDGFVTFAAAALPDLSRDQTLTFLLVLIGGPVAYTAAYAAMAWICEKRPSVTIHRDFGERSKPFLLIVFYAQLAAAAYSLARGGAFSQLANWTNFATFIETRNALFSTMSFPEFANIYVLLPTCAALIVLVNNRRDLRSTFVSWLPVALMLLAEVILFQKRPAIMALLLVYGTLICSKAISQKTAIPVRRIFTAAGLVCVIYLALVLIPYVVPKFTGRDDNKATAVAYYATGYAGLSILMRTAPALLNYPSVFPDKHPFYGLDLGRPLRSGPAPDEAAVIWKAMYPNAEGNSSAPFNFIFYSQGGVVTSLVASGIMGGMTAFLWLLALNSVGGQILRSALGGILLCFSILISMDSVRNSVLVSYGYLWALAFVIVVYALFRTSEKAG